MMAMPLVSVSISLRMPIRPQPGRRISRIDSTRNEYAIVSPTLTGAVQRRSRTPRPRPSGGGASPFAAAA